MAKRIYGDLAIQDQKALQLFDADSSNKVSLRAPATVASDVVLTLPATDGNANEVLITDGSGALSFELRVKGPTSATDNTLPRFDSTTGSLIQGSAVVVDDSDNMSGVTSLTLDGTSNQLLIQPGSFKYTFTAADPAADRTITIEDVGAAATLVLSSTGTATDNRLVRMDSTTGSLIQESAATLDDSGNLTGLADVTASGTISAATLTASAALTLEETGAGTDKITIQAPSSIAAPYTLTLPVDDGASGQLLSTDGSGVLSWVDPVSVDSFKADWDNADGTTLVVTHNLGSTDVIVQIFDTDDMATIDVDSVVRTDGNTVTLTASSAPAVTWRVMILAV